jgi:glutamyl/glutaminyl-tRNA synthetase
VTEYQRQGYLPEAMVNFLALLGWSPGNDQEIFTRDELVRAFSIAGISSSNAVFNPEKLDWVNSQHIARMPAEAIARELQPILEAEGLWSNTYAAERRPWLLAVIELLRPRLRKLTEFPDAARFFLAPVEGYDPGAVARHLSAPGMADLVAALRETLARVEPFQAGPLEAVVRALAEAQGVLELIGRDATIARLADLERFLRRPRG